MTKIINFFVDFCEIKHKGINVNVNFIIQLSQISGQGRDGTRNGRRLWYAFCRSGFTRHTEGCIAVIRCLLECMPY
jgi:hypothetical protein